MPQKQLKSKSDTGGIKTRHRATSHEISYVLKIIREAERNPTSEEWEYATDHDDFLLFLSREIKRNGSITPDEM